MSSTPPAHSLLTPGRVVCSLAFESRRVSRNQVRVLGIDPGKSGGFAIIDDPQPWAVKMPETTRDTIDELRSIRQEGIQIAFVELVGGYIGKAQPASSAFVFGYGTGVIGGALAALGFEVHRVRPQTWQKAFSLKSKPTESKTAWKNRLKSLAQDIFPHIKVTLATSDALLIAEFGRRWLSGNITIELNEDES